MSNERPRTVHGMNRDLETLPKSDDPAPAAETTRVLSRNGNAWRAMVYGVRFVTVFVHTWRRRVSCGQYRPSLLLNWPENNDATARTQWTRRPSARSVCPRRRVSIRPDKKKTASFVVVCVREHKTDGTRLP